MLNILKSPDRRAKRVKMCGPKNFICRVLFMSDSLSSVWDHLMHICKIFHFKIFRRHIMALNQCSFHPVSTTLCGQYGNQGGIHAIFSSTLCYCTAEQLSSRRRPSSVRPSVVRPWNSFSQNLSSRLMPNLVDRYLFTIFADNFFVCQNFSFFIFLCIFFFR